MIRKKIKNNNGHYLLGIDIGGTKIAVLLGTFRGKILCRISEPSFASQGPKQMITRITRMGNNLLQQNKLKLSEICGIGISCGGPLDPKKGIIESPPNLPGWNNIPIKRIIQNTFHAQTCLENDANAGALAEYYWGGGKGKKNIIFMTMGTGIGGGIILDGKLYQGTNYLAGEIGHTIVVPCGPKCNCGKYGCLESIASGTGIAKQAQEYVRYHPDSILLKMTKGNRKLISSEIVCQAARKGDKCAREVIADAIHALALGLSNLIQILNPEVIVLGTLMFKANDLFLAPVRKAVRENTWNSMEKVCKIIPSPLKERGQDLATLAIVRYNQESMY